MSSLAPFSGFGVACPKCRQTVETTRYCGPDTACALAEAGEHLHRTCRCGYAWPERCADWSDGPADRAYPFEAGDDTPAGDTTRQFATLDEVMALVAEARRALYPADPGVYGGALGDTARQFATLDEALEAAGEARRLLEPLARPLEPADLPIKERPASAPGGTGGRASERDRADPVVLTSDDSFPASDPPAR
jgi:hypothetical protein